MAKRTRPWKQSYRALPNHILGRLAEMPPDQPIAVGCAQQVSSTDVERGVWEHTGITTAADELHVPPAFMPPRAIGPHSRWNIDGRRVPLKDRPKTVVTYCWDSPNWGDPGKGSHLTCTSREVWQKETRYGKSLEVSMRHERASNRVVFTIEEPLFRNSPTFDRELLEAVNLLQENVGCADIFVAGTPAAFPATVRVRCELLPVGDAKELLAAVEAVVARTGVSPDTAQERLRAFQALNAQKVVVGSSGFTRYIGAILGPDLVVLENVTYGNAMYVLGADWEDVSQRSRVDLLRDPSANYDRVVHRQGWESRLANVLRSRGYGGRGSTGGDNEGTPPTKPASGQ